MTAPSELADALALLQRYGLATAFSAPQFAAAYADQRRPSDDDDEPDEVDEDDDDDDDDDEDDEPEPLDWDLVLAALVSLYGAGGPTAQSLADGAFALDEAAAEDDEILARVREVFTTWLGAPLPDAVESDVEEMCGHVASSLFLRHGGPQLYMLATTRPADDTILELYLLRDRDPYDALPLSTRSWSIGPDVEAAAAGIFRWAEQVPLAYAEHVPGCAKCRALLLERARLGQLPPVYAELAARLEP